MNSTQRPAAAIYVFNHSAEGRKLPGIPYDPHFFGDSPRRFDCSRKKGFSSKLDKCLIGSHAGTLAAGQNEGRHSGFSPNTHALMIHVTHAEKSEQHQRDSLVPSPDIAVHYQFWNFRKQRLASVIEA